MTVKCKQSGLTLTETTLVIATVGVLVALGLPALRTFVNSFESGSSAKSLISAALASGRAIAAKNQRYAGIRFQKAYCPEGPLEAPQYMIFIVQDPNVMAYGFRAVEGLKPIKLPETIGVMDFTIVTNRNIQNPANLQQIRLDHPSLGGDQLINDYFELTDTTTFSIIFSPSGKLAIHGIRVRNKNGYPDTTTNTLISNDDVFNKKAQVDAGIGMFYQDDYFGTPDFGLGPEASRNSFIIYEKEKFTQAYKTGKAWSDYLVRLVPETVYINPYMGTIISQD